MGSVGAKGLSNNLLGVQDHCNIVNDRGSLSLNNSWSRYVNTGAYSHTRYVFCHHMHQIYILCTRYVSSLFRQNNSPLK